MEIRGLAMIGLSGACIAVAGLVGMVQQQRELAIAANTTIGGAAAECMASGFDTPFGRVGCFVPTSHALTGSTMTGIREIRGGALFVK